MNTQQLLVTVWNALPRQFFKMRSTTRIVCGKLSPYRTYLSITFRSRVYHAFIFDISPKTKESARCTNTQV